METHEYLGISLLGIIKKLAGRVRVLEELVRAQPELLAEYNRQVSYRAAYEEDEYERMISELKEMLEQLPKLDSEQNVLKD
jgi:hypothetical protein